VGTGLESRILDRSMYEAEGLQEGRDLSILALGRIWRGCEPGRDSRRLDRAIGERIRYRSFSSEHGSDREVSPAHTRSSQIPLKCADKERRVGKNC
jgi:hypothetical protein